MNTPQFYEPEKFTRPFGKYAYFEDGSFKLNEDGTTILYRKTELITSYSGSDYWCHQFICELLNLYSGSSEYNYSLGTCQHRKELPRLWKDHKDSVIAWYNKQSSKCWFKMAEKMFDYMMTDLEHHADIFKD